MVVKMNSYTQKFFNKLQRKIDKAIIENQPIDAMVKKQIEILKYSHDEFVSRVKANGHSLDSIDVAEIEIQQFSAMKALAQKIGLPVQEYDELIKNVKIRVFGEENYKKFFEK